MRNALLLVKLVVLVAAILYGLVACAGDDLVPDASVPADAKVDPPPPDAAQPDATPPCLVDHQWTATSPDDPPFATVSPAGRLLRNDFGGGLGIDDGYIDTGEVLRIDFETPVHLLEYTTAWPEDGPDDLRFPGEHDLVVETVTGEPFERHLFGLDIHVMVDLRDVVAFELRPTAGDRMALGRLLFERCNSPPPDAGP